MFLQQEPPQDAPSWCYEYDPHQGMHLCMLCNLYVTEDHLLGTTHQRWLSFKPDYIARVQHTRKLRPGLAARLQCWKCLPELSGALDPAVRSPYPLALQQPPCQQAPQQQPLGWPQHQRLQCQQPPN